MFELNRAEILKTLLIEKLDGCSWYTSGQALGFNSGADTDHTGLGNYIVTLFFDNSEEGDETILEEFSNYLSYSPTDDSNATATVHDMNDGVIQVVMTRRNLSEADLLERAQNISANVLSNTRLAG